MSVQQSGSPCREATFVQAERVCDQNHGNCLVANANERKMGRVRWLRGLLVGFLADADLRGKPVAHRPSIFSWLPRAGLFLGSSLDTAGAIGEPGLGRPRPRVDPSRGGLELPNG